MVFIRATCYLGYSLVRKGLFFSFVLQSYVEKGVFHSREKVLKIIRPHQMLCVCQSKCLVIGLFRQKMTGNKIRDTNRLNVEQTYYMICTFFFPFIVAVCICACDRSMCIHCLESNGTKRLNVRVQGDISFGSLIIIL